MKKGSTLFLKIVICLIAIGALAGMLWFPQTEGRAANLDLISIYTDPFIIYIYRFNPLFCWVIPGIQIIKPN